MSDEIFQSVLDSIWKPEPGSETVDQAFREAVVQRAIEICHETGEPEGTKRFVVDTVMEWLSNPFPPFKWDGEPLQEGFYWWWVNDGWQAVRVTADYIGFQFDDDFFDQAEVEVGDFLCVHLKPKSPT